MIVDSHLVMSQILYKNITNQMDFKLDRLAFTYGNIKPDFSNKDIKRSHTLDESLESINLYSKKLMSKSISVKDFSRSLGVICHFACDYFCLYHREGNEKKGAYEHLVYEIHLHVKLLTLLLRGKIKLNNQDVLQNNVEFIALNIQNKYNLEPKSLTKDITYALSSAYQISKLIVCLSQFHFQQNDINIRKKYGLNQLNVKSQS
ncbi:zinc dependent phospholipase C family protein [Clostridium algoriphilum]|uniref:zinc dependent phospholipase C family protein n=1 Tax=Clostridium algoriphilum TaxID=198347 RepID=UPI001CF234B6|nr:zinc dependent phospholipase C family protein [Clostridium algoriphilum]MCB2295561.1 zinc dependent phospholipase C family protein [Clostridium algoriphilum]